MSGPTGDQGDIVSLMEFAVMTQDAVSTPAEAHGNVNEPLMTPHNLLKMDVLRSCVDSEKAKAAIFAPLHLLPFDVLSCPAQTVMKPGSFCLTIT
jgi:hypothetical protein